MTAQEQITVQKMALKLDTHLNEFQKYVAEDERWKENFSNIVSPLLKEEADNKLIHEYIKSKTYYFLKVIGGIGVMVTIIYYVIAILRPGMPAK